MRALRRSSHPTFWDANLMRFIWQEIIKTHTHSNSPATNTRLAIRSILHWISYPSPTDQNPSVSQPSPAIWSLCLQVWSQLIDWAEITSEDLHQPLIDQATLLSPVDQAILTMLSPIIRSASRRYSRDPLNRHHAKLFKDACQALEFLLSRFSSGSRSTTIEQLVLHLVHAFLRAVRTDHRVPAPEIVSILLSYPHLESVGDRWSREGISDQDYRLYRETLNTIHSLGRASLLVEFWLGLLPLINLARAEWPLSRLLSALEELSNPLIRAMSGKSLNGFRFARLVLKIVKALESETDSRLIPSRLKAFRLLVERRDLHTFDWLSREERKFDKDGIELKAEELRDSSGLEHENLEALFRLWQLSWGLTKRLTNEADGEPLPLSILVGITRLVQRIRTDRTVLLLRMVISRFVADRTPPLTEEEARSKYLYNPRVKLTDIERTRLIESHLTVGGELSRKFLIECFESFTRDRVIPSVEDMKFLHGFLIQLDPERGRQFWIDRSKLVHGLPWNLFDHSQAFPVAWDQSKIQIAKEVFTSKFRPPPSSDQGQV